MRSAGIYSLRRLLGQPESVFVSLRVADIDRLFRDSKHYSITDDQVQAAGADRGNVLHFNPVVLRLNLIGRNLRDGRRIGGTRWSKPSGSDSTLADRHVTHDASVDAGAGLPVTFGST